MLFHRRRQPATNTPRKRTRPLVELGGSVNPTGKTNEPEVQPGWQSPEIEEIRTFEACHIFWSLKVLQSETVAVIVRS